MIESIHRRRFARHWPFAVAVSVWLVLVFLPPFLQSEPARGVVAAACIALMTVQWFSYRKVIKGADFLFSSLIVGAFGLVNLWMVLNVLRFYTYDADSGRGVHIAIVSIQEAVVWTIAALSVAISGWSIWRLCRTRRLDTSRTMRIVRWCAVSGFCIAWLLLGYSAYCFWRGVLPWELVFQILCPSSIVAIGLEHSSALGRFIGWLFIAAVNAALYALVGLVLSPILRLLIPPNKRMQRDAKESVPVRPAP